MKIYDLGGKENISVDRIYQARTALRLSQSELADRMQVNGVPMDWPVTPNKNRE